MSKRKLIGLHFRPVCSLLVPVGLILALLQACAPAPVQETWNSTRPDTTVGATAPAADTYRVLGDGRDDFNPRERYYDILHTELDLSFDFQNEVLIGVATHRLTPLGPETDSLGFDATHLEIETVTLTHAGWTDTLTTEQRPNGIVAYPVEALRDVDTVDVRIHYTAHPTRSDGIRGLHFVDGPGVDPSLPTQVWTLSQPEDARFWFPTWDYPNDFMSFTIHMTVPDELDTFANGDLVEQHRHDGSRTDTWRFDGPHVPYLAAFAVGEFSMVQEYYSREDGSRVDLVYLVEDEFANDALAIFGETPAIMGVMERRTGMSYPWNDYKQVVVQEFSAGGMEHTTMSTLSSRVLRDSRARLDQNARNLIVHELAHQWFGNLMTSESWAHLALNEGFAQYFETVYLEDEIGADEAQEHAMRGRRSYLTEARSFRRPIVWYGYDDPYRLYDRHTYAKGARVLSQLRFELGEEAWWKGVRAYVHDNQHQTVTTEHLKRAMEAASGRDLQQFFDQWYDSPGHPELLVEQSVDPESGKYRIRVQQMQDTTQTPLFTFDTEFVVRYRARSPLLRRVTVSSADTTFLIGTTGEIEYVRFDVGAQLLADIRTQKPFSEWVAQARNSPEMAARYEAVGVLSELEPSLEARDAILQAIHDPYDLVRMRAVEASATYADADRSIRRALVGRVADDPSSRVRAAAIRALVDVGLEQDADMIDTVIAAALHDASYAVTAAAITAYAHRRPDQALDAFDHLLVLESYAATVERALASSMPRIMLDDRVGMFIGWHSAAERLVEARLATARLLNDLQPDAPARQVRAEAAARLLADVSEPVRLLAARAIISSDHVIDAEVLSRRIAVEPSDRVQTVLEQIDRR